MHVGSSVRLYNNVSTLLGNSGLFFVAFQKLFETTFVIRITCGQKYCNKCKYIFRRLMELK